MECTAIPSGAVSGFNTRTLDHPTSVALLAPNAEYRTMVKGRLAADETDKTRITTTRFTYVWGEVTYDDIFRRGRCFYRFTLGTSVC